MWLARLVSSSASCFSSAVHLVTSHLHTQVDSPSLEHFPCYILLTFSFRLPYASTAISLGKQSYTSVHLPRVIKFRRRHGTLKSVLSHKTLSISLPGIRRQESCAGIKAHRKLILYWQFCAKRPRHSRAWIPFSTLFYNRRSSLQSLALTSSNTGAQYGACHGPRSHELCHVQSGLQPPCSRHI